MKWILFILLFVSSVACSQRRTMYFNTGRAISINDTGKPSSVSFATPPYNPYYDPETGDITFTDSHFQYSIPGYAKTNFTARSPAGFVDFKTSETAISIKVGGDWSTATSTFDGESEVQVFVNGVYNQSVLLTADDVTETHAITLPGGEKIVTLVNGYTAVPLAGTNTLPDAGVYIQGVVTTGPIEIEIPVTPVNKKLFVGNSITTGATSTHPTAQGYAVLFRWQDDWEVQLDSWGARTLATHTSPLASEMCHFISDEMNGTTTNELFMMLGTNNFALSGGQSKAVWKLCYQNFLDTLHSIRPDITIYCVSPLNRASYSTPNSQGAALEDYVAAIEELLVTRTWAKYIYGKPLVSLANMADGAQLHPNTTGHQQFHDNLLIEYNLLQP